MNEITGGSPSGAGVLAGGNGSRRPSENEPAIARSQGRHAAAIAKTLPADPFHRQHPRGQRRHKRQTVAAAQLWRSTIMCGS
jgi:hypothetical protein